MIVVILLIVIVIFVIWYRQRNPVAQTTIMLPVSAAGQAPLMAQSGDLAAVVSQTTEAPQSSTSWVPVANTPYSTGSQAMDKALGTTYDPADPMIHPADTSAYF